MQLPAFYTLNSKLYTPKAIMPPPPGQNRSIRAIGAI